MTTVTASHSSKAVVEDATIKVAVNYLSYIWAEKAIQTGKALIIDLFKFFKMILNTLIVLRVLRFSRAIYRRDVGHGLKGLSVYPLWCNIRRLLF